jgi:hypothetical protein
VGDKNGDLDRDIKSFKKSVSDAKSSGKAFKLFRKGMRAQIKALEIPPQKRKNRR